jgi:hypothetical protein
MEKTMTREQIKTWWMAAYQIARRFDDSQALSQISCSNRTQRANDSETTFL